MKQLFSIFVLITIFLLPFSSSDDGRPYSLIDKVKTECEIEALTIGTMLADRYNSFDEATEWDVRFDEFAVEIYRSA